jgi:hypothetical protein
MIRMALAVFAIGTYAAQVIEAALEDDTDYTDPESDTP